MMKMKFKELWKDRFDCFSRIILAVIPILLFFLITHENHVFGSNVDWIQQHSAFPDYFRKLFYETKKIIPDFSKEIGGGQNIFNFAYYGLFNPLYMISYLLPHVSMYSYIQGLMIVELIADGQLCYHWLKKHFHKENALIGSLILILAAPILIQSYRQLMFVNYMPFLLLAFLGLERYREKNKYGLLVASLTCILLISFYFGLSGYAALFLFEICAWNREKECKSMKTFCKECWHLIYPFILAGMLAMFYLIPEVLVMLSGRSEKSSVSIKDLFMPYGSGNRFLYYAYGIGLSVMMLVILSTGLFYKKCREKWLSFVLYLVFLIPVCSYVFNGTLYIRDKAFIPFLPVLVWLFAYYLQQLKENLIPVKILWLGYGITLSLIAIFTIKHSSKYPVLMLVDYGVCGVAILCYVVKKIRCVGIVTVMIMLVAASMEIKAYEGEKLDQNVVWQVEDSFVSTRVKEVMPESSNYRVELCGQNDYEIANTNYVSMIGQKKSSIYSSVYNSNYAQFRDNIGLNKKSKNNLIQSMTNNPIFLRFMGVRYLISSNDEIAGYQKINPSKEAANVYENDAVAPMMYLTDHMISYETYNSLAWYEKQLALLYWSVGDCDGKNDANVKSVFERLNVQKIQLDWSSIKNTKKWNYKKDTIKVNSKKKQTFDFSMSEPWNEDEYLFLSFDVKSSEKMHASSEGDGSAIVIIINGQYNRLNKDVNAYANNNDTFHYVLAHKNNSNHLQITFGAGKYTLSNVEIRKVKIPVQTGLYQESVKVTDTAENEWKVLCTATSDKKLITSVPYDSNFQVLVDGKKTSYEIVNDGFLGVNLPKGEHVITLTYHAPGKFLGGIVSILTLLVIALDCLRKKRKENLSIQ